MKRYKVIFIPEDNSVIDAVIFEAVSQEEAEKLVSRGKRWYENCYEQSLAYKLEELEA